MSSSQITPATNAGQASTIRKGPAQRLTNRDRILVASVELFNRDGIVPVTTNHIASHLDISPGNLYFHFRNKEEILRELFDQMCEETYLVWKPARGQQPASPMELIEASYEVFFRFRFFHREMYHLRRKDPELALKWRRHLAKTMRLLKATYASWVKRGIMRRLSDDREMRMLNDMVLIASSSFLQFFESSDKPATKRSLRDGLEHLLCFLMPYHTEGWRKRLLDRLNNLDRPLSNAPQLPSGQLLQGD